MKRQTYPSGLNRGLPIGRAQLENSVKTSLVELKTPPVAIKSKGKQIRHLRTKTEAFDSHPLNEGQQHGHQTQWSSSLMVIILGPRRC